MDASYPFFGYVYNHAGYYHAPIKLDTETMLENFLDRVARHAIEEKREVMVTDCDDYAVFHAKGGEILFPKAGGPGQ